MVTFNSRFERSARKGAKNTEYYDVLNVSEDADINEIKRAYKILAMECHPDRPKGDSEKFKKVQKAYEVLSDPQKRKLYDDYGEKGLESEGFSSTSEVYPDIFNLFFSHMQQAKGETIDHRLTVKLEQVYKGYSKKIVISRKVICPVCNGCGGPPEFVETCPECKGCGSRVYTHISDRHSEKRVVACDCRKGKTVPADKRCKNCTGRGTVMEKKTLDVYIEKGVPNHHQIVFQNEADEDIDMIPGDVRIFVEIQEHDLFRRKENDLYMVKELSLYEAFAGYKFLITHLDGRKIIVKSQENERTDHGTVRCVRGEGMPIYQRNFTKGNLFIEFKIRLPLPNELLVDPKEHIECLKKIYKVPKTDDLESKLTEYDVCQPEDVNPDELPREDNYERHAATENKVQCSPQ